MKKTFKRQKGLRKKQQPSFKTMGYERKIAKPKNKGV
jgi:hypothetical protein